MHGCTCLVCRREARPGFVGVGADISICVVVGESDGARPHVSFSANPGVVSVLISIAYAWRCAHAPAQAPGKFFAAIQVSSGTTHAENHHAA